MKWFVSLLLVTREGGYSTVIAGLFSTVVAREADYSIVLGEALSEVVTQSAAGY